MKYNQNTHKNYLQQELYNILDLLGIDRLNADTVTFRDIRQKLNELYPATSVTVNNVMDYDANKAMIRDRKKIFSMARYTIYTLSAIRKREENAI